MLDFFFFFFRILPTFNILNILAGVRSFFINTVKNWNNLSPDIAVAKSLEWLKAQVEKLLVWLLFFLFVAFSILDLLTLS
jgi:hypothetical protein